MCKVADFGLTRETTNDEYDVKKVSVGLVVRCGAERGGGGEVSGLMGGKVHCKGMRPL